jgi:hypothetical protein
MEEGLQMGEVKSIKKKKKKAKPKPVVDAEGWQLAGRVSKGTERLKGLIILKELIQSRSLLCLQPRKS